MNLEDSDQKLFGQGEKAGSITARISRGLSPWLVANNVCLLLSSYQSGRLFVLGAEKNGELVFQQHQFDRAMGISASRSGFAMGTLHQVWRFSLMKPVNRASGQSRATLTPQACYYTGFVNCHDVAQLADNSIAYASTLFNCVARVTSTSSFAPIWAPPFIESLAPGDQCHLNGLATENGKLRFVSMLGVSNQSAGWRENRSGGAIFDLKTGKAIASNLWMPHSPRVHKGRLYALESGSGSFGTVEGGKISGKLNLPGYPRGLDFCGDIAVIGFSRPRAESIDGLPLKDKLGASGIEPSCGIVLYDTNAAAIVHSVHFSSGVDELYDVAFFNGTSNPVLIHPASNEIAKTYSIGIRHQPRPEQPQLEN